MTEKEKQINLQVNAIRANLHEIMKDIEPRGLYNKLVGLDRQVYRIREIVKEESKYELDDDNKRATKEEMEWIPVSERLPDVADGTMGDVSNDVLMRVTDGEGTTISVGFYGYYPNCSTMKGWWCMWAHGCDKLDGKCKVVAWMPLPKVEEVDQ